MRARRRGRVRARLPERARPGADRAPARRHRTGLAERSVPRAGPPGRLRALPRRPRLPRRPLERDAARSAAARARRRGARRARRGSGRRFRLARNRGGPRRARAGAGARAPRRDEGRAHGRVDAGPRRRQRRKAARRARVAPPRPDRRRRHRLERRGPRLLERHVRRRRAGAPLAARPRADADARRHAAEGRRRVTDPRLVTLGLAAAFAAYVALVRDRRGAPPARAIEASIPTGIEITVAHAGTIKTRRFGRRILVGRAPSADLRLDDPRVSRLHARIEMRDDGVYVEDLGSRNGTAVDGEAVTEPRRLEVDDEVTVGSAALVFRGVGAWR